MSRVVCHLRPSEFFGGPEKQILEHARRLVGSSWTPCVACFSKPGGVVELIERASSEGIETFSVETLSNYSPYAIRHLRKALAERSVDLLVCHGYRADLIGRVACAGTRIRKIAVVRGYTAEMLRVRLYEWIDRRVLTHFDRVVAVSEATRASLCSSVLPADKIDVVHNGVSIPERPPDPAPLAAEAGFDDSRPLLVAAGRLSPEKGHQHLIRAARLLADRGVDAGMAIVGEGREREQLERTIGDLDLGGSVKLFGHRRDPLACLAAADVVVNPSETEGSPNVVLEAMSIGRPIVATSVGGVPEILADDANGVLVPPGSPARLAEGIARVLADSDLAQRLGRAARTTAIEGHSFDAMTERYEAIYDRVWSGARGAVGAAYGGSAR